MRKPLDGESGQAAVETALVLPLMVFLVLGVLQLTTLQHAKLLTEYAAFNAARAGIVWNGNNERMQDAAIYSVLPTLYRTDSLTALGQAYERFRRRDEHLRLVWGPLPIAPQSLNGAPLNGIVRVDTLNPAGYQELDGIWKVATNEGWKELDFDDVTSFMDRPGLKEKFERFENLQVTDPDEELLRRATVLTIRVRYLYEMKVPFANWIIFVAWYAANARVALQGGLGRETTEADEHMLNVQADASALELAARGIGHEKGFPTLFPHEMHTLWDLSQGRFVLEPPAAARRFFLPLSATYSMRMQSAFHRKWLMHPQPSWKP